MFTEWNLFERIEMEFDYKFGLIENYEIQFFHLCQRMMMNSLICGIQAFSLQTKHKI